MLSDNNRTKGFSRVYTLTGESPLPKQALTLNVFANKEQVIKLIVEHLCSLEISEGQKVIVTGPDPQSV